MLRMVLVGWLAWASLAQAQGRTVFRTYQVADVLTALKERGGKVSPEARLIRDICGQVKPKSWASAGGVGTIEYYPITMGLVVDQTPEVHGRIAKLLEAMQPK